MTTDTTYLLGHDPAELARLEHQARILAPATGTVLRLAGIAPGMRVLDLGTGKPVLATGPVAGFVRSLALGTRDGVEILVAASGNAVRCWALYDGRPLWTVELADPPLAVAIGPDGEVRALGAGGLTTAEPSAR